MSKSAFQLEHKRTKLAVQHKLKDLEDTYITLHPEIKDLNTAAFWNKKFSNHTTLRMQDGMTQDRVRIVADLLTENSQNVSILDIGMGEGWLEELLVDKEIKLFGNDISDESIQNAKKKFNGNFTVQSLYHLKYKREFDAIFLLEVLEHVPPSKTFTVLQDIRKLLKKDGFFIVSVPTNEGLETMRENPNGHVRLYTVPLITAELEIAGFRTVAIKTLYAFKKFYPVKKQLAKILRNHWKPNNIIIKAQKI